MANAKWNGAAARQRLANIPLGEIEELRVAKMCELKQEEITKLEAALHRDEEQLARGEREFAELLGDYMAAGGALDDELRAAITDAGLAALLIKYAAATPAPTSAGSAVLSSSIVGSGGTVTLPSPPTPVSATAMPTSPILAADVAVGQRHPLAFASDGQSATTTPPLLPYGADAAIAETDAFAHVGGVANPPVLPTPIANIAEPPGEWSIAPLPPIPTDNNPQLDSYAATTTSATPPPAVAVTDAALQRDEDAPAGPVTGYESFTIPQIRPEAYNFAAPRLSPAAVDTYADATRPEASGFAQTAVIMSDRPEPDLRRFDSAEIPPFLRVRPDLFAGEEGGTSSDNNDSTIRPAEQPGPPTGPDQIASASSHPAADFGPNIAPPAENLMLNSAVLGQFGPNALASATPFEPNPTFADETASATRPEPLIAPSVRAEPTPTFAVRAEAAGGSSSLTVPPVAAGHYIGAEDLLAAVAAKLGAQA